jgi:hypothetical protein
MVIEAAERLVDTTQLVRGQSQAERERTRTEKNAKRGG